MKELHLFLIYLTCGVYSRRLEDANIPINNVRPNVEIRPYEYLTSEEIFEKMQIMAEKYPNLMTMKSAQEEYGLPDRAGGKDDCPFEEGDGCSNFIITIEDINQPEYVRSRLPDVFLSGAVHGNERIGPSTVVYTAELLLEAASCEALPHSMHGNPEVMGESEWKLEVQRAWDCRYKLEEMGITHWVRQWLARLVSTRRIVIMPTANALGYYQNTRTEGLIDPNRDFPFDQNDPTQCMQTMAGRSINEVWRDHLFQMSLTFHAGMVAVAYEWGAVSRNNPRGIPSPDDTAQIELGGGLSRFAGRFSPESKGYAYPHDSMNNLVYPVRGGMEDWAYAGSWDTELVQPCTPQTFSQYPESKTTYNNSTLRSFNILVETSDDKIPDSKLLGTNEELFVVENSPAGNGHITRNIRMSLMSIDIVQPYVHVLGIHDSILYDDVVPLLSRENKNYEVHKIMSVQSGSDVDVHWTVGGAFTIDETFLIYDHKDNFPQDFDGYKQVQEGYLENLKFTKPKKGRSRWNEGSAFPDPTQSSLYKSVDDLETLPQGSPIFTDTIDLSSFKAGDELLVVGVAKVDSAWLDNRPQSIMPDMSPQSHIVNGRTNNNWKMENAGKVIEGREYWISIPMTVRIRELREGDENIAEDISLRWDKYKPHGVKDRDSNESGRYSFFFSILLFVVLPIVGIVMYIKYRHRKNFRQSKRNRVMQEYAEVERSLSDILDDIDGPDNHHKEAEGLEMEGKESNQDTPITKRAAVTKNPELFAII